MLSYSKHQYAAGIQNWAIARDHYNRIYIANNEGLLVYNGTRWQLYPVPNKTILRSIAFATDGRLYAGAQDELGYFMPDKSGRLIYTSLKNLLAGADKTFADIWNIHTLNESVFFRADDKIFCFSGGKITVYRPPSRWIAMSRHHGRMLAQDESNGLFVFENNRWQTFIDKALLPAGFILTDIIPYAKDTSLVSTTQSGLFLLSGKNLISFKLNNLGPGQHFTSLAFVSEDCFLAGTYSSGIYQFTRNGDIIDNISAKNALANNTVHCIYADSGGNVWTGLDNGIAHFTCNGAVKHIISPAFNNGGGYHIKALNGNLYFALSTGLQYTPLNTTGDLSTLRGEPTTILSGLTWNLSLVNNQLLAGRDDGLWKISGNKATLVSSASGFWNYQLLDNAGGQMAAGNYNGIRLFAEANGQIKDEGALKNFTESSRYMETDGQNIWVSHPYRGVFKIDIAGNSVLKYTSNNGLPAELDNHVFKLKNQVVFATPKGIYEYDAATNKIIPAKKYAGLFGQRALRYLKEDEKGNIWFVQDKMLGVADFSGPAPAIHYIPELNNRLMSGFENIYLHNTRNIFVGADKGFYHINYEKYRQQINAFSAYISLVRITGSVDSILYGGYGPAGNKQAAPKAIPYRCNSLYFEFSAAVNSRQTNEEFSSYLEGFDKGWSSWGNAFSKEYTNLPEGKYTFHVKARNSPTHESEEFTWSFSIRPPWYRSWWAYIIYITCIAFLFLLLYRIQEKKHRRKQEERRLADKQQFDEEQRRLAYQHQLEIEQSEKQLIRLKNENLEAEIEYKNAELAGTAMNLVQKKEFLLKITEELNRLNKSGKEMVDVAELKKILRTLSSEEKLDEEWKQFSIHFNNVHRNFLINLKNKYPNLNAHELKLCAYLRMNLSSKEMARLMSISIRGVEINRYRLRKKLQLQPKQDLFEFLLGVEAPGDQTGKNDV